MAAAVTELVHVTGKPMVVDTYWIGVSLPAKVTLSVPLPLVSRMRESDCIEIASPAPVRLQYLLRDYAYLGHDPQALADTLGRLKELQGKETVLRWQAWSLERNLPALFAELIALHYDPHYERSQARHFRRWGERRVVAAPDLSEAGIESLAASLLGSGSINGS